MNLDGLHIASTELPDKPKRRVSKVIYRSDSATEEFEIDINKAFVHLEGGVASKSDDDIGYLVRNDVDSEQYWFSPGVASIAIVGDGSPNPGFQGKAEFVVEQQFVNPSTGAVEWKALRPDGNSRPTFMIDVKHGASRRISDLSDWKVGSFSVVAAETQHRLRYLGHRNGQAKCSKSMVW